MLDSTSIEFLEARIGFGLMTIPVAVAPSHRIGTSGRTLPAFHKLANLENIYNTADEVGMSESEFDLHLSQLKKDAVLYAVNSIFNLNPNYVLGTDYSYVIAKHPALFDDAIGYSLAVSVIEQAVSTTRENDNKRNARLTYSNLKIELEGLRDTYGAVVSGGLRRSQYFAIKQVASILFPNNLIIESPNVW